MCTEKNRTLSQFVAEKIASPPKSDGHTNISNYRVASLPKRRLVGHKTSLTKSTMYNNSTI